MIYHDIVKKPVISEKTNAQKDGSGQVTFEVDRLSNRIEIKRAVESIFKVRVEKVRTMQVKGKVKRRGRIIGKRKNWKKAIITLVAGERIDFFEGV